MAFVFALWAWQPLIARIVFAVIDIVNINDSLDRYASEQDLSLFAGLVSELEEKRIDSYPEIVFDENS